MQDESELRDELLEAAAPDEVQEEAPKKRNTKQALLQKILEVAEKGGIPLDYGLCSNRAKTARFCAESTVRITSGVGKI